MKREPICGLRCPIFTKETWIDIEGFEGLYKISSQGNVLSLSTNKIMKRNTTQGYYFIILQKNGVRTFKQIHRLVAEGFLSNPLGLPIVNHRDEDKLNPSVENLEWCTYSYNNTYRDHHKKIGESLRGREPWNKGKIGVMSKEARDKIRLYQLNKNKHK